VPVVCNPGGWDFDPALRRGPGRLVSLSIERLLAARTDAYVCVSEAERQVALAHRIPSERLHVVHNAGAVCEPGIGAVPELERFSREGPLAGCVAVLSPRKGIDVLVRADDAGLRAATSGSASSASGDPQLLSQVA
jgi:Glycosyl transferase 4-like domain